MRRRSALSSAATERYLNELRLTRSAKQICLSLAPYRACKSLTHSRRRASVSSFLPARPAASPCRGSDRQPASSAADFPLPAAAYASAPKEKCRRIFYATYRKWHPKCPACDRRPALTYPVQPASGQKQSALR